MLASTWSRKRGMGGLWAVQAKAYDPAYRVKKADVDSFLSESARAEFSYRLLIATTDLIGSTARRTLAAQEKPAGLLLRSQLAQARVDWPGSVRRLVPMAAPRKQPYPHQREAVEAILAGFRTADRGQALMACGTGKTLVGLLVAEALQARSTLVLVPSLSLLAQTLREWMANAERSLRFLAVCSDETVDVELALALEIPFRDQAVIGGKGETDEIAGSLRNVIGRDHDLQLTAELVCKSDQLSPDIFDPRRVILGRSDVLVDPVDHQQPWQWQLEVKRRAVVSHQMGDIDEDAHTSAELGELPAVDDRLVVAPVDRCPRLTGEHWHLNWPSRARHMPHTSPCSAHSRPLGRSSAGSQFQMSTIESLNDRALLMREWKLT